MSEDSGPTGEPGAVELQAEVERLRAEKAALEAELAQRVVTGPKRFNWRNFTVWVLIVLAGIMALFAPIAIYMHATFMNTDQFVSTVAPLIREDAVATAVSDKAAQAFLDGMHVGDRLRDQLPDPLDFIATPIEGAVEDLTRRLTQDIITSDNFYARWESALRLAHQKAVGIIRGDAAIEVSSQGVVSLDVGELLANVRDRLSQAGLVFLAKIPIPQTSRTIVLFTSPQLGAVQGAVHLLDVLYWLLPLLAFLFFAAAVLIAEDRRRALMISGAALAIVMAMSLLALNLIKTELFSSLQNADTLSAALVIWGDLTHDLVALNWGLLALGIVIGGGAAIAGPYRWAGWLRSKSVPLLANWRERRRIADKTPGPIGTFVNAHAWALRLAGFIIAFVVLIPLGRLTGARVIWTAVILFVYLAAIELVRAKEPGDE